MIRLNSKVLKIFYIVFFTLFFWLFINGVGKAEYNYFVLAAVEIAFGILGIVLNKLTSKLTNKLINILLIVIVIALQITFTIICRTDNTWGWDFDTVVLLAKSYVNHKEISFSYLATYSTNILYFWLVVFVFKVSKLLFGECYTIVLLVCNVLVLDFCVFLLYKLAARWKSKEYAKFVCVLCGLFSPFWLYLPIAYQDIFSIPFYILPVLIYTILVQDSKKYAGLLWTVMGVIGCVGFHFKGNTLIALIAVCIYCFLNTKVLDSVKNFLAAIAGFVIAFIIIQVLIFYMPIFSPGEVQEKKIPLTHLIYMGMVGDGTWNAEIVGETMSYDTYEEKKEHTILKIKETLNEYGIAGLFKQITYKESTVMWNVGTLNGDLYICRDPRHENVVYHVFLENTLINTAFRYYSQSYWRLCLILCMIGCFARIKKHRTDDWFCIAYLIVFGTLLFFAFWEGNSRYLVNAACFIILIAAEALEGLYLGISNLVMQRTVIKQQP